MRKITKIRRSVKGISPVISVLLMIAIAVAASLVAYAWVMGYMDFTTTKVGKAVQIQSITSSDVYVQNIGDSPVEISAVYVNGNLEDTTAYAITVDSLVTNIVGTTQTAQIAFDTGYLQPVAPDTQVTVKIVTSDGISAEYTETFP
ncbi:MAG: archaellin/type IV pilin N-terminal domain-containing protein [Candidatus Bathyarchaeia archaeon]|jgi:flagellin-like protein